MIIGSFKQAVSRTFSEKQKTKIYKAILPLPVPYPFPYFFYRKQKSILPFAKEVGNVMSICFD